MIVYMEMYWGKLTHNFEDKCLMNGFLEIIPHHNVVTLTSDSRPIFVACRCENQLADSLKSAIILQILWDKDEEWFVWKSPEFQLKSNTHISHRQNFPFRGGKTGIEIYCSVGEIAKTITVFVLMVLSGSWSVLRARVELYHVTLAAGRAPNTCQDRG